MQYSLGIQLLLSGFELSGGLGGWILTSTFQTQYFS